jgi:predicted O-methyltransferase YrrM
MQKKSEILQLLKRVRPLDLQTACEIGAAGGGTTFLLSRVARADALIVSIDRNVPPGLARAAELWARPGQVAVTMSGNSQSEKTVRDVQALLGRRKLDLLFIDGDHSYEGVSRDYLLYRELVRPGGLIAFHDIVPDHLTRFGQVTKARAGGVSRLWQELRHAHRFEEYIEDPQQDGYGIGLLVCEES